MWLMKRVGQTIGEYENEASARKAFIELEAKGRNYGNVYVKGPNGETINCWDL